MSANVHKIQGRLDWTGLYCGRDDRLWGVDPQCRSRGHLGLKPFWIGLKHGDTILARPTNVLLRGLRRLNRESRPQIVRSRDPPRANRPALHSGVPPPTSDEPESVPVMIHKSGWISTELDLCESVLYNSLKTIKDRSFRWIIERTWQHTRNPTIKDERKVKTQCLK
jgi:hypothetical protein